MGNKHTLAISQLSTSECRGVVKSGIHAMSAVASSSGRIPQGEVVMDVSCRDQPAAENDRADQDSSQTVDHISKVYPVRTPGRMEADDGR